MKIMNNFNILDLNKFNAIKFYGKNHTYKINNEVCPLSVTRFLNLFTPDFDRDKIAAHCARRDNVSVEEVIKKWEFEKDIACIKGTIFHNYVDNFLANKVIPIDRTAIKEFCDVHQDPSVEDKLLNNVAKLIIQFEEFYSYYNQNFYHLKSEFVTGDIEDTRICGTIDNLSIRKRDNKLFIFDYKTNKDFTTKSKYNNKLKYPVEHLDDTKLNVYGLQLSIYKYFIKKYTNLEPECVVVWFNEKNVSYKLYDIPLLDKEVYSMFEHYKNANTTFTTLTSAVENYILSIA